MIKKLVLAVAMFVCVFLAGRWSDHALKVINGYRFGWSSFSGQSIASANRMEQYNSLKLHDTDFLIYGDSIIELTNFSEILRDSSFLNRGISGNQVNGLANRIRKEDLNVVKKSFVMIGINNLLTGQPLDEVKEDLNSLKDVVCGQQAKIIWMSVLPVNPEIFRREILSRSPNVYLPSSEQIFDLNEHIRGISDTCPNITFFDVSDSFMDVSGNLSSEFTIDGLHLSSAGSKALAMIVGELSHEK